MELEKDIIDKQNRATTVKNYDYGKNQSEGTISVDTSEKSILEYSQNGDLIYEDYQELDEFLETIFIPENVTMRKKMKSQDTELHPFIRLSDIVKLRLSEMETKHVMEYLDNNGILVRGTNSSVDEEFENYDYYRTYKDSVLPQKLEESAQAEKFALFYQTKDPVLREQLIISNMRLAAYIAYKMSAVYGFDIHELEGYGYEGLIEAVDRFNPHMGTKFSSYGYKYIKGYILSGISELQGLNRKYWYGGFMKAKLEAETDGMTLETNPELADKITAIMVKDGVISKETAKNFPEFLKITFCKNSLEDEENTSDLEESQPVNIAIDNNLKETMIEALNTLTPREKLVIELRFGFADGETRTLEEIAKELGVNRERIRQIEAKALRKLRHPARSRYFRPFSHTYAERTPNNYNPQPKTYLDEIIEKHISQGR